MPEPRVIVLLISPFEGVFSAGGDISEAARKSCQTLTAKGMKLLFVTKNPLEEAARQVESLDSPAAIFNPDEGLYVPENADLQIADSATVRSVNSIINELRAGGDIVIPVGIGRLPEHSFLNDVELAALLPGSDEPNGNTSVYRCRADGPAGWSEWAETMMRRIKIILSKSEMRQWNGA